ANVFPSIDAVQVALTIDTGGILARETVIILPNRSQVLTWFKPNELRANTVTSGDEHSAVEHKRRGRVHGGTAHSKRKRKHRFSSRGVNAHAVVTRDKDDDFTT